MSTAVYYIQNDMHKSSENYKFLQEKNVLMSVKKYHCKKFILMSSL